MSEPIERHGYAKSTRPLSRKITRPAILLLGATGAGKSTFVSSATGLAVDIGHTLNSHTVDPRGYKSTRADGAPITIIDTPGFNDTTRPDTELLSSIVQFIQQHKYKIVSVVYIHSITSRKLTGSAARAIQVLGSMCGPQYFQHIVVVSSMWTTVPVSEMDQLVNREEQFNTSSVCWGDMLEQGAVYLRWDDTKSTPDSLTASEIIRDWTVRDDAPQLALSMEMGSGVKLEDTATYQILAKHEWRQQERERRARVDAEADEMETETSSLSKMTIRTESQSEDPEIAALRAERSRLQTIAEWERRNYQREMEDLRAMEEERKGGGCLRQLFSTFTGRRAVSFFGGVSGREEGGDGGIDRREEDQVKARHRRSWFGERREGSERRGGEVGVVYASEEVRSDESRSRPRRRRDRDRDRERERKRRASDYEIVVVRRKAK